MKRQSTIIAIFALFMFAVTANAQFGSFINKAVQKAEKVKQAAKKTKQQIDQLSNTGGSGNSQTRPSKTRNNDDNWVTFSKIGASSNERSNATFKQFGCGDSVYATANFSEAVDASDGFTVTMLVDGESAAQQQMNGGAAISVTETIHFELVPDDNARVRYPTAALAFAEALLKNVSAGNHTIKLAVSVGSDDDTIAVGTFKFNNASGCKQRFERTKRKLNKDIAEQERNQPDDKTEKNDTKEQDDERPAQTENKRPTMVEIVLEGSCGSSRIVTILNNPDASYPDKDTFSVANGVDSRRVPVGAQIFLKAAEGSDTELIYTVGTASRQTVKVCR